MTAVSDAGNSRTQGARRLPTACHRHVRQPIWVSQRQGKLTVIRPRRMHQMQTIATEVPVAWCVSLWRPWAMQKRLNGSGSIWDGDTCGPRDVVLDGEPRSPTDSMRPSPNYFDRLLSALAVFDDDLHKIKFNCSWSKWIRAQALARRLKSL